MSTTHTPNFGEPWQDGADSVGIDNCHFDPILSEKQGGYYTYVEWQDYKHKERAIACVNACAGITDPAAAIQAARDALKSATDEIACMDHGETYVELSRHAYAQMIAALKLLQPND